MQNMLLLIFILSFVCAAFLFLFIGLAYLMRPQFVASCVFSKNAPSKSIFWSKKKEDGEFILFYYGARTLLICISYLFLFWVFRAFNF